MLDTEGPIWCLVMPLRKDPWGKKEALNDTLIFCLRIETSELLQSVL